MQQKINEFCCMTSSLLLLSRAPCSVGHISRPDEAEQYIASWLLVLLACSLLLWVMATKSIFDDYSRIIVNKTTLPRDASWYGGCKCAGTFLQCNLHYEFTES